LGSRQKLTLEEHRAVDVALNEAFARALRDSGKVRHRERAAVVLDASHKYMTEPSVLWKDSARAPASDLDDLGASVANAPSPAPQLNACMVGQLEASMRTIRVAEIRIDGVGRLLVVPELPPGEDLGFIYRAAMEIAWDGSLHALASPAPRSEGWSHLDWFGQIVRAVADEYGASLVVGPGTKWLVPEALRREIEQASKS
jgi:hypothetical protein